MSTVIRYVGKSVENMRGRIGAEPQASTGFFTPEQARTFKPIFRFLNDKDRDILCLIFVSRKRQIDVAKILKRTQSSLAYDIKRIRRRLQFIHHLQRELDNFIDFIEREREGDTFTMEEIEVLTMMFYTSSFTLTARVLETSPVRVRHSFTKCLRRMEEKGEECQVEKDRAKQDGNLELVAQMSTEASRWYSVYEIFAIIRDNLNIIKRVYNHESVDRRHRLRSMKSKKSPKKSKKS